MRRQSAEDAGSVEDIMESVLNFINIILKVIIAFHMFKSVDIIEIRSPKYDLHRHSAFRSSWPLCIMTEAAKI